MKRIDTMTESAKKALGIAIENANKLNSSMFPCLDKCSECPFNHKNLPCLLFGSNVKRTADEWKAWAEEEV